MLFIYSLTMLQTMEALHTYVQYRRVVHKNTSNVLLTGKKFPIHTLCSALQIFSIKIERRMIYLSESKISLKEMFVEK